MCICTRGAKIKGFTFTEVVVSTGIVVLIGMVLYSCLKSGIDIWRRGHTLRVEEELGLFLERFSSDIKNSFPFQGLDFIGDSQQFQFPTLVSTGRGFKTVGQTKYSFDPYQKTLNREESDYSAIYTLSLIHI